MARIGSISPSSESSDIIFAGRLIKEKHADLLIQAVALLQEKNPDIHLVVIGEGPEYDNIIRMKENKHRFTHTHIYRFFRDHDDLIAQLKSSKVFVLPSTREGFGITALEALACGLPVVTIDHPSNAVRDLITENNGFLCSLSAENLADKISLALEHHVVMKNACIESAKSFDWDRIILDLESYYQSVINH